MLHSIIRSKCRNENEQIFKEEISNEILEILTLIEIVSLNKKGIAAEKIGLEFRLKLIAEI